MFHQPSVLISRHGLRWGISWPTIWVFASPKEDSNGMGLRNRGVFKNHGVHYMDKQATVNYILKCRFVGLSLEEKLLKGFCSPECECIWNYAEEIDSRLVMHFFCH